MKPSKVISGSPLKLIHGARFDSQDRLYVASNFGQSIYRIDRKSGKAEVFVGPPSGEADDLTFAADGTLVWTSFLTGAVRGRKPDGSVFEIARIPGCNPIAFNKEGRLFTAQAFEGFGLFEIFLDGRKPRKLLKNKGGMNGFDFGPDGLLYSPLQYKGEVVKINVDTGETETVATDFKFPGAVKFDSKGNLWVTDVPGEVVRVDVKTGKKTVVARVEPGIDNLAIDSAERIVITNNSSSYEINPETGEVRTIFENKISAPGGLGVFTEGGKDNLYLADLLALRVINGETGEVKTLARNIVDALPMIFNLTVNERHVYVSDAISGQVQKRDRKTGSLLATFSNFQAPQDALEVDDGSVIIAQWSGGNLLQVSGRDGNKRRVIAAGLAGPLGLVAAPDGAVFVTESTGGLVSKVSITSDQRRVVTDGLEGPEGIALAPNGKLIVAEVGKRRLLEIDPVSGTKKVLVDNLPIGLKGFADLPETFFPTGVAVSPSGTVYVTSDVENAILRFEGLITGTRNLSKSTGPYFGGSVGTVEWS